ncbi:hypothetical protein HU200_033039 [Digitaria exilis]|uniref:F-box associated domain-containing protein n=1 Tax=Digitaria exilis TaxID=1010633 RepID=A0A835EL37_9POAL|nr:hypothetical protein HU200_033039 [Digitaria exilis]
MEKAAAEDEPEKAAQGAAAPRKKQMASATIDGGASGQARICDDVAVSILARLPARAAVSCTALSKHHRRLIRSLEFASLHCRLGAPLPPPHIAYLATAPIKRRPEQTDPDSVFHGFHLAGAVGLRRGDAPMMRALTGWRHLGTSYVNTCNGVVLLAPKEFSKTCKCTLWNPAVADVSREGVDGQIKQKSLYMDGTIYLLHLEKSAILAFDVDDETATKISIPGERQQDDRPLHDGKFELIEMSGRPCMVTIDGCCLALWLLTADHQWDQKCVILDESSIYLHSIIGVWDCGGLLVLYFELSIRGLWLYDVAKNTIFKADLPGELTVERLDYEISWGYKPTLVSPGSIVGEISQDLERRRNSSAHIAEVINPLGAQDRRKGEEATLNTVCLMEFLVRIMQKLPNDMRDVLEMPTMDSEDSDYLFESVEDLSETL